MERCTIVFAYGAFGCAGIVALREAGFGVALVVTHEDEDVAAGDSVFALCKALDIPVRVMGEVGAEIATMRALSPEYLFSFYYRSLLPEAVLALGTKGAFNLHGSLLPRYRGRAPVNWVLVNGETETGVTLHHMVARADAGDIVAQTRVAIADEDTALTLQGKLLVAAKGLLAEVLPKIAAGSAPRIAQDLTQGSYFGRRTPEDGTIDWTQDARVVRNLVRAVVAPWPGAFTFWGRKKLMVWEAFVAEGQGRAGAVLSVSPLVVACGKGALRVVVDDAAGLCVGEVLG